MNFAWIVVDLALVVAARIEEPDALHAALRTVAGITIAANRHQRSVA